MGSVTFSLLSTPDVDFDLGGLANVFDIPGISLLLRHIVQDQLEQTVVFPNSFTLSLLPEDELHELIRQKINNRGERSPLSLPKGVLNLRLIEAKGLKSSDFLGSNSDPYAILSLEVDGQRQSYRTEVTM